MPDLADLKEDLAEAALQTSRTISNIVKRQYRLRLTKACRVCNNLNLQGHDETFPIGRLDLGFTDVRSAARSSCPYCTLILTFIEQLPPGLVREKKVMLQYHNDAFLEMAFAFDEKLKFEIFLSPGKPVSTATETILSILLYGPTVRGTVA